MAACKKYKSRPPHKSRAKKSAKPARTCVFIAVCVCVCVLLWAKGYRKKYIINVNKLSEYSVGAAMTLALFFCVIFFF